MTNHPHIHQEVTEWFVIARVQDGVRQVLTDSDDSPWAFPSLAAGLQFLKAEGFTDDEIAETFFVRLEDDDAKGGV